MSENTTTQSASVKIFGFFSLTEKESNSGASYLYNRKGGGVAEVTSIWNQSLGLNFELQYPDTVFVGEIRELFDYSIPIKPPEIIDHSKRDNGLTPVELIVPDNYVLHGFYSKKQDKANGNLNRFLKDSLGRDVLVTQVAAIRMGEEIKPLTEFGDEEYRGIISKVSNRFTELVKSAPGLPTKRIVTCELPINEAGYLPNTFSDYIDEGADIIGGTYCPASLREEIVNSKRKFVEAALSHLL